MELQKADAGYERLDTGVAEIFCASVAGQVLRLVGDTAAAHCGDEPVHGCSGDSHVFTSFHMVSHDFTSLW